MTEEQLNIHDLIVDVDDITDREVSRRDAVSELDHAIDNARDHLTHLVRIRLDLMTEFEKDEERSALLSRWMSNSTVEDAEGNPLS